MASSGSPEGEVESKKLVIFGATGRTGRPLVEQALQQGHHVTAVVRNVDKLDLRHENLEIVKGDIMDLDSYAETFKGKDAILSAFGSPYHSVLNPTTMYSESMKGILVAMKRHNITRIIVVTSWATKWSPTNSWFMEWILKPFFLGGIISDMSIMEDLLDATSADDVDYTIVRPPQLTNDPPKGNYKIEEGYSNTGTVSRIPRADVAEFMLKCLSSDHYKRKGMAIASLS